MEDTKDNQRTERIEKEGYRVIRFWDHEVLKNMEAVLERIRTELHRHPHPGPPPSRGRV
jgi:very-short-patch-repair endonuclease